jgi:hypothetical protein
MAHTMPMDKILKSKKILKIGNTVEPLLADTSLFSPKLVISIRYEYSGHSQLRTAVVSPKGVLNREVPQYCNATPLS